MLPRLFRRFTMRSMELKQIISELRLKKLAYWCPFDNPTEPRRVCRRPARREAGEPLVDLRNAVAHSTISRLQ
jgi:hypothetical protein